MCRYLLANHKWEHTQPPIQQTFQRGDDIVETFTEDNEGKSYIFKS